MFHCWLAELEELGPPFLWELFLAQGLVQELQGNTVLYRNFSQCQKMSKEKKSKEKKRMDNINW